MIFLSTFITGLEKPVEKRLRGEPVKILSVENGLAVYETGKKGGIQNPSYLNNSFILLKKLNARKSFEQAVEEVCRFRELPRYIKAGLGFRVMFSWENAFVSINENHRKKIEAFITSNLRLQLSRRGEGVEFWFLKRSGGEIFFAQRLPGRKAEDIKGKLRPELGDMMCWLAQIRRSDIICDPFCGYGAIPEAAAKYKPERIFAGDIEEKCVSITAKSLGKSPGVIIKKQNALELDKVLAPESVDKIITDPPWGLFDKGLDQKVFYPKMMEVFAKVLKPGGRLVMLTGRETNMDAVLPPGFMLIERYNLLVNGKKASLHIIERLTQEEKNEF